MSMTSVPHRLSRVLLLFHAPSPAFSSQLFLQIFGDKEEWFQGFHGPIQLDLSGLWYKTQMERIITGGHLQEFL